MADLPDDVLPNIFIRLPAKQLVQMRCVCKTWNARLSESSFIESHLNHSIHNNEKILLLFQKGMLLRFTPGPITGRPSHSPHIERKTSPKLNLPVDRQLQNAEADVVGSVNGLICFCYATYEDSFTCIWNPSISALFTLPPHSLSYELPLLGFGFDPKADDYKVVRHENFSPEPGTLSQTYGEVYSMRKGSWETISHMVPSHVKSFLTQIEVCVNGRFYWLCVIDFEVFPFPQTVVVFDLSAMKYSEIPLPDSIRHDHRHRSNVLGVLGGKLCVMSRVDDVRYREDGKCDVWVMDHDDESWVKHHVFSQFSDCITPYGFTSDNEFLFQVGYGRRFALYDPVAAKTKIFKIRLRERSASYKFIEYVDSLVWITPPNRLKV